MRFPIVYPELYMQIAFIIVSFLCFTAYFFSYSLGKKYERNNGPDHIRRLLKFFYAYIGSGSYLSWMLLSLLPQPRFPNLISMMMGDKPSWLPLLTSGYGLVMMVYSMMISFKATSMNFKVTLSDYDYLKPRQLITGGQYAIVRHPMVICAFFHVLGLALFTGAYYTLLFMPVYFVLNDAMNWIQEKYVLKAEFPEAYAAYSKKTPRILTWWMLVLLLTGVLAAISNF